MIEQLDGQDTHREAFTKNEYSSSGRPDIGLRKRTYADMIAHAPALRLREKSIIHAAVYCYAKENQPSHCSYIHTNTETAITLVWKTVNLVTHK